MALHALLLIFQYWLFLVLLWLQLGAAELAPITGSLPGCLEKCGNISIPYPFGIGEGCYIDKWFSVKCDLSLTPLKPVYEDAEILDISVRDSIMRAKLPVAKYCDNGTEIGPFSMSSGKFIFSESHNKFFAIGCNTIGYFTAEAYDRSFTGCVSVCYNKDDVTDGSCNGVGCCQTSIEKGLALYSATVAPFYPKSMNFSFSPCSYAFLAEQSWFTFSKSYIQDFNNENVPAIAEWTVGNETCKEAKRNLTSYACRGANTNCSDPAGNVPAGYLCHCKPGYEGNPYLPGGCQDINECKDPDANPCKGLSAYICKNTEGGHECICPPKYRTHTRNDSSLDCEKLTNDAELVKILTGTILGLLLLLVCSSWLYWIFRKKKLMQLKEKFFQQNGGLILQRQLLKSEKAFDESRTAKIFTAAELSKATKNFDESRILGQGGYGTVYKGILPNGTAVAIKKSKIVDRTQIEQFINEVVVLSQVNHRNVVKLLGCCLETEVPLLVYEFITNGTLFEHLHGGGCSLTNENRVSTLSWDNRLRIAAEVAGSLAYLHSSASIPIIHRDVKSANVLLDDNYTAKVADFGASRLVSVDQTQLTTLVQGTLGYLDPEYFHTSHLTEKSDVYSFGVVLAELLTGKKALSPEKPEEERSLAGYILSSIKNGRLFQILDDSLACEGSTQQQQQVNEVAELTKRCLRWKGETRPTMKEVAMVLDGLRRSSKDPWIFDMEQNDNKEEKVHLLLDIEMDSYTQSSTSGSVALESQVMQAPLTTTGR